MTDKKDYDLIKKQLQIAKDHLNQQYGTGSVMSIEDNDLGPWPSISTGALSLDVALGIGGLPKGRVVEVYGPEGSGKSTMCCHVIAEAQKTGGVCAYIDVEHALDPAYAKHLGVDLSPEKLIFSQPGNAEEALDITEKLINTGAVSVVVIDSVASLIPDEELKGGMDKWQVGLLARLMGKAMRKLEKAAADNGTLILFTNQIRYKVGMDAMFGNPETTPGGMALRFAASARIRIQRKGKPLVDVNGELVGVTIEAQIVKNRMGDPLKKVEFDLMFGEGFDNAGCVLDLAVSKGLLTSSGAWIKYPNGDVFAQGRSKAIQKFHDEPELMAKFKDEILNEGL